MATSKEAIKRLQDYFTIGIKPNAKGDQSAVYPLNKNQTVINNKEVLQTSKAKMSQDTEQLYKHWLGSTIDAQKAWKSRECLWDDMDALYFNCQVITKAIELVADEVIQADSNDQIIFIDAKRPVKKYIQDLFDKININSYIRPITIDTIQYGNAGMILGFDDKGVSEIVPIEIRSLKERLEFCPYEVKKEIQANNQLFAQFNKMSRMKTLIDSILDKEETTSYFKKYLFGFQIEDTVLPPWKFIHFRNMTNKSPFAPFGIPLYIHSMAAYKQFDAAMTLKNAARVAAFPKQVISINLPNQMDPATKIEKAMEAMNEWLNIGFGQSKKELPGLGDCIFTIKDLFEFSDVKVDVDLGDMGDIDVLMDLLINSTFIPRYMLDPRDSGFGDTGVALIEKSKPFARLVYRFQSIILEGLTQLVKIHMLYNGEYNPEDTKFTLSMKYPESQINQDIVSSQNAMLDLANNIIAAIQDKITGGELLPPELVKSIYAQFLPWDDVKSDKWIDDALKAKDNGDTTETVDSLSSEQQIDQIKNPEDYIDQDIDQTTEQQFESYSRKQKIIESMKARKMWRLLEKQIGCKVLKEQVNDIIFEEVFDYTRENVIKGRHIYSSKNRDQYFAAEQLGVFNKEKVKKLKEDIANNRMDDKINLKEEFDYVFTYASQDKEIEEQTKLEG